MTLFCAAMLSKLVQRRLSPQIPLPVYNRQFVR